MPAPLDTEQASYQRALDFLIENEPESVIDIECSYESYIALQKQARELYGDAKYPRLDYFEGVSRLRIKTQSSPLVTGIGAFLQQSILNSARDALLRQNRPDLAERIVPGGEFGIGYSLSPEDQAGESTQPPEGETPAEE
ncbi:hypothetical protein V1517DRAFT_341840 [Lipomyces orientalis]|uniref:Uncharacterized protein n=1 Tax=Lipomyces orientalis TaxID=1233043 RepID=A0ACC3TDR8_9ASCO